MHLPGGRSLLPLPAVTGFGVTAVVDFDGIEPFDVPPPPGWRAGDVRVRAGDATPPGAVVVTLAPDPEGIGIAIDGLDRSVGVDPSSVVTAVHILLDLEAIRRSPTHTFLHAGVVAWSGRALVVAGPSGAGKSTATIALASGIEGARYLSDERAPFDDDLAVTPVPLPVAIKDGALGAIGRHDPATIGLTPAAEPVPIGGVVLATYEPGASWAPEQLSPAAALAALLAESPSPRDDTTMRRLHDLAAAVPVYRGTRGDAAELVAWAVTLW